MPFNIFKLLKGNEPSTVAEVTAALAAIDERISASRVRSERAAEACSDQLLEASGDEKRTDELVAAAARTRAELETVLATRKRLEEKLAAAQRAEEREATASAWDASRRRAEAVRKRTRKLDKLAREMGVELRGLAGDLVSLRESLPVIASDFHLITGTEVWTHLVTRVSCFSAIQDANGNWASPVIPPGISFSTTHEQRSLPGLPGAIDSVCTLALRAGEEFESPPPAAA